MAPGKMTQLLKDQDETRIQNNNRLFIVCIFGAGCIKLND